MVIDSNSNGIKNHTQPTGGQRSQATGNSGTPAPAAKSDAPASGDRVVLSQEAQSLQRLQGRINDLPDVDSERVASLKQAIADGRFEVNAERIAENMLRQDELLN
ncbi:flagellar biosynthesis anti-sigma factor FlgM [Marinimicrobium alkaliphilum]|uniref:flagellar biosynthesis anti-sigma factor FlgM n=1 Tax=Marinimicrobium alkaliphilum TaxID=2202654 RepID=UPI000DB9E6C7|nr:flagellar biosynthesis anti-sigma factor FlgM [Marinimicrobium alkaliphilum]